MRLNFLLTAAASLVLSSVASGATLTQKIGSQVYTDGQVVTSGTFLADNSADPAPFNAISGSDVAGPNFSASWTFNSYGPVIGSITSATLLIASWDFDTNNTSGSQVGSFDMNGTNLATILDSAFTASRNTANSQIKWYTITLPSSTYAQLATGSATFNLALQNGRGVLGNTTFNGGAMDFSTLTVNTGTVPPPPTVPEPSTFVAVTGGLAALLVLRRKRNTA